MDNFLRTSLAVALLLGLAAGPALAETPLPEYSGTLYIARVSSERTWQHLLKNPLDASYADAYLLAAAVSRAYSDRWDGALRFEMEGNIAYNFGDQHHWEVNAVPILARWRRFPWSHVLATSAAFGLGLSYASEIPDVEVELEGDSHRALVYIVMELTAGRPDAPWAVSLRLHHRSVAWGLMGEDGGVNAVGFGVRYRFR